MFFRFGNIFGMFANFVGNIFRNPVAAIGLLCVQVFDIILGLAESVIGVFDAIFGTNMANDLAQFRNELSAMAESTA